MPVSQSKQVQTCLNAFKVAMDEVIAANARVQKIKMAVVTHGLAGSFPVGSVAALNTLATNLNAVATSPVVAQLSALYVATHEGKALPGEVA